MRSKWFEYNQLFGDNENVLSKTENVFSIFEKIFSFQSNQLPSLTEWHKVLNDTDSFYSHILSVYIRSLYVEFMYPIISHELITDISSFVNGCKVIDPMAGSGWFSYWLNKYGCDINSFDNFTWTSFDFLSHVKYKNVKDQDYSNYDIVFMSWPNYNTDAAFDVWQKMEIGQYLIYIGERKGGSTGNSNFFKAIRNSSKIEDTKLNRNFISFFGIRDEITVFIKNKQYDDSKSLF